MTKAEIAECINRELSEHGVERTHANAQRVLESLLDHCEQVPDLQLTPEIIHAHADMVLVATLDTEFTN